MRLLKLRNNLVNQTDYHMSVKQILNLYLVVKIDFVTFLVLQLVSAKTYFGQFYVKL